MGKNKLTIKYDFGFQLVAVNASVKEYKLAWILNRNLELDFIKTDNIEIVFVNDKLISISNFICRTEHQLFRLLSNKAENLEETFNAFLIPELKNFDYFIAINDESDTFDLNAFISRIKQIPFVQFAVSVDPTTLKSKDNLIF